MSRSISERTSEMCALFSAGMKAKRIAELFGVQTPAVYKALRTGGVLPPYARRLPGGPGRPAGGGEPGYTANRLKRSADFIAEREAREPLRPDVVPIDRDPCFYCGARGDLGCKHRAAAQ
jgi:hypothetical protein